MHRLVSAKVIFYFILLTVLDGSVMPAFQIFSAYPSFLYLFICYAAFEWGTEKTVYVAFWAGLMRDLLGGGLIGLDSTILVALVPALGFLIQKVERQLPGVHFLITFLFVFFAGALRLLVSTAGAGPSFAFGSFMGMITLTAIYTTALLPFFNFLTDRWFGHSTAKQYELFR